MTLYIIAREVDFHGKPSEYVVTSTRCSLDGLAKWQPEALGDHLHQLGKNADVWVGGIDPVTGCITHTDPPARVGAQEQDDGTYVPRSYADGECTNNLEQLPTSAVFDAEWYRLRDVRFYSLLQGAGIP